MGRFHGTAIILVAAFPCLLLLRWIRRFGRNRPESRLLVIKLFAFGLASPLLAVIAELIIIPLCNLLPAGVIVPAQAFLGVAFVEELIKFGGMTLIVHQRRAFESVFDGAVYGISVAMGFALAENILYVIGAESGMIVALVRNFTAVPLHALTGSLMGIAWSRYKLANKGSIEAIFFIAVVIHGAYNWFLMDSRLPVVFSGVILIVGWCTVIVYLRRVRNEFRKSIQIN